MEFITATGEYLEKMWEITLEAQKQLRSLGLDQWQKGYPSREIWEEDIREKRAYLAMEEGRVCGVFAFQTTPDPSYGAIDGKWLTDGAYASMHRVCVADGSKGRGVAGRIFAFGFERAEKLGFPAVRIDTHPGNLPMQRALEKAGFQKCGEIYLAEGCEAGDLRWGYEACLCTILI